MAGEVEIKKLYKRLEELDKAGTLDRWELWACIGLCGLCSGLFLICGGR
jgi:hypothetical protein